MLKENMYDKIIENLYVGSASALNHSEKFSLIVNCTTNVYMKSSVRTIRIPIDDDPYDTNLFLELLDKTNVLEEIHMYINNKEPVLIHCYAGQQRSCALVTCYLMKYNNMTPDNAINHIKQKRRIAFLGNITFISAIVHFYHYKICMNNQT